MMTKFIASFAIAAVVATAAVGASAPAEAYYRHHYNAGPGIAAGIIGGLAVGAIVASQRPYYDDGYVYDRPYERCRNMLYERDNGQRYWRRVCN
jgi:hypothetical protein